MPTLSLTYDQLLAAKLTIALLASALLAARWIAHRRGRASASRDIVGWALGALALAGALAWWNFGVLHFGRFLHHEDMFHYFVGAKYFPELKYDGLYVCSAAADVEAGLEVWVRTRNFRELRTNEIVSGASVLGRAGDCQENFSPERWEEFKRDVAWFRARLPLDRWALVTQDHGYNATPAWGSIARLLCRNVTASDTGLLALALIDPLLLIAMWGCLAWAFGWHATAVAAVWWGTNLPGEFAWIGGSFLRQDWLLLTAVGVCLARRGKWTSAGGALACATLLRVFPVFLACGLGLKAVASLWRRRSFALEERYRRFAAGYFVTAICVIALSSITDPIGSRSWIEFLENSRVDMAELGANQVGFGVLLTYDRGRLITKIGSPGGGSPVNLWQEEKKRVLASRRWIQAVALLAFLWLFLQRARNGEDWEALVLGAGFVPFAVSFSSYYAAIFLLYGLLWRTGRDAVALSLTALAAWTQCAMLIWGKDNVEGIFFGVSVGTVIAIGLITALTNANNPSGTET